MAIRDPHAALPPGTVLGGSYRLTGKLAEGGMAAVYEAVHLRLERKCAVKVLSRDLAANAEALARFHREAQITSQLAHPHIVQVTDFGTVASGEPFLVMEFLQGEDLSRRLRRKGRLPSAAVLPIVKQITSALSATHARGVIHRDLKPANIFLLDLADGTEFVKVVDFGISKIKRSALRLTRASVLMGTPGYMAPEQATGNVDDIDPRTDLWALACITWEMLTGREPFGGRDLTELLYHVVHHEPAPLAGRFAVLSPSVEEVLRKALKKRQKDRWPTVAAFTRALEAAMPEQAALEPTDARDIPADGVPRHAEAGAHAAGPAARTDGGGGGPAPATDVLPALAHGYTRGRLAHPGSALAAAAPLGDGAGGGGGRRGGAAGIQRRPPADANGHPGPRHGKRPARAVGQTIDWLP